MGEREELDDDIARIDATAAAWLVRSSGGLSAAEQAEYEAWLARDKRHREWTAAHAETRKGFGELAGLLSDTDGSPDPDLFAQPSLPAARPKWKSFAWVAGVAAALAVGLILFGTKQAAEPDQGLVYASSFAATGFERHFLADGTLVELKDGSRMKVEFGPSERRVALLEGEVHFGIAKDTTRPFVVYAGEASFRAIGTSFNVRLTTDEVELLVTEGVVRVDKSPSRKDLARSEKVDMELNELAANQMTTISFAREKPALGVETVSKEIVDKKLEWKHEILAFEGTPLSEAIRAFNLRNRDQIEIADRALGEERIDATFRSDNLKGFVKMLEISAGLEADWSQHGRIVCRRKESELPL